MLSFSVQGSQHRITKESINAFKNSLLLQFYAKPMRAFKKHPDLKPTNSWQACIGVNTKMLNNSRTKSKNDNHARYTFSEDELKYPYY